MPYSQRENRKVQVACLQMTCTTEKAPNVEKTLQLIAQAAKQGANIVCTQELFHNQYPCQTEDHAKFGEAEPIPGPTSAALAKAAKQHGIVIVGSLFEKRAAGLYHNTAVVYNVDGSLCGMYRKMHIPDDPLYYEKFYFTPGDLGFRSFETAFGKVGVCICWDQWYPEAARLTALTGAEIIFYPTAIGWLPEEKAEYGERQYAAWQTIMRSHSIANGVFVAAPNRVGKEGALQFWGGSFVSDPNGQVMAQASHEHEAILQVECDLGLIDVIRTHWPFLRDRRIDAYSNITKRFIDE
jgi:N-carbamoylputrescine amidase